MAVRLGRVNVDAMLRSLTAKQFIEWECYARLEPFNELRADQRAALIASTVYNMAVARKDRRKLEDFLLTFEEREPAKKQTPKQQFELMKILAAAHAGDDGPPPKGEDKEVSAAMREQVKRAHEAMKGLT